jgi:hypothetical protein
MLDERIWAAIESLHGKRLRTVTGKQFEVQANTAASIRVKLGSSGNTYPIRRVQFGQVLDLGIPIGSLAPGLVRDSLAEQGIKLFNAAYVVPILQYLEKLGLL